ncbi:rod shape-determining protein RodA [Streptomyces alkaliterrae]|uniref:peptidoglycan glycosyltransferase n=1 Tax=Streptomyces alkaliterrae TaxID=2213162 RepID=A0A5P0YPX1_9ACTN|nr:rod shape-determining protein RodA [Streptomyces alkaliterrae]MBB1259730.1 rod shape-determining protein RodA [Streptomyces alkaliterrae]MQS01960.1 rod shape-determining protein RodA [Streptomyces alkaliterrae]
MSIHSFDTARYERPKSLWARLRARDSLARRLDWPLLLSALALCVIGSLLVWSATRNRTELTGGDPNLFLVKHVMNAVIGIALAAAVLWIGHRRLRSAWWLLYVLALILVALVYTPIGATINGERAWLNLGGGFFLQPSEFAKVTVPLAMAVVLAAKVDAGDREHPDHRTVLLALVLAAIPIAVIADLGQVMVLAVIVLGVLLASGASNRWVFGLITAAVAGGVAVWMLDLLDEYQINRFAAFANPALDPSGVGYNTNQARIAIGSGGLTGKGLFQGTQTTGQFVPEQQTDFIFTVAGEELGFLGGALILLLLGVVMWRACRIAMEATDLYSTIIAAGVVAWFAFQSFENIGMALGIMPVAGLPLPFVSYGGTSMFAAWIAVGLLQSIRIQRPLSA